LETLIEIDFDSVLRFYQKEFPVDEIYSGGDRPNSKYTRPLSTREKELILDYFFNQYFYQFFSEKSIESSFFFIDHVSILALSVALEAGGR